MDDKCYNCGEPGHFAKNCPKKPGVGKGGVPAFPNGTINDSEGLEYQEHINHYFEVMAALESLKENDLDPTDSDLKEALEGYGAKRNEFLEKRKANYTRAFFIRNPREAEWLMKNKDKLTNPEHLETWEHFTKNNSKFDIIKKH